VPAESAVRENWPSRPAVVLMLEPRNAISAPARKAPVVLSLTRPPMVPMPVGRAGVEAGPSVAAGVVSARPSAFFLG